MLCLGIEPQNQSDQILSSRGHSTPRSDDVTENQYVSMSDRNMESSSANDSKTSCWSTIEAEYDHIGRSNDPAQDDKKSPRVEKFQNVGKQLRENPEWQTILYDNFLVRKSMSLNFEQFLFFFESFQFENFSAKSTFIPLIPRPHWYLGWHGKIFPNSWQGCHGGSSRGPSWGVDDHCEVSLKR